MEREERFHSHFPNLSPSLILQSLFMLFVRSDLPGIFPIHQENCWEGISLQSFWARRHFIFRGCARRLLQGGSRIAKA